MIPRVAEHRDIAGEWLWARLSGHFPSARRAAWRSAPVDGRRLPANRLSSSRWRAAVARLRAPYEKPENFPSK